MSGNSSSRFDTRARHTSLSFVHMNPGLSPLQICSLRVHCSLCNIEVAVVGRDDLIAPPNLEIPDPQ
jgi:hypothetical protein